MICAFSSPILPISDMGLYFPEKQSPPLQKKINDSYEEINKFMRKSIKKMILNFFPPNSSKKLTLRCVYFIMIHPEIRNGILLPPCLLSIWVRLRTISGLVLCMVLIIFPVSLYPRYSSSGSSTIN